MADRVPAEAVERWTIPFCPDCGCAGVHAETCGMFPEQPVTHGNFEEVHLASCCSLDALIASKGGEEKAVEALADEFAPGLTRQMLAALRVHLGGGE